MRHTGSIHARASVASWRPVDVLRVRSVRGVERMVEEDRYCIDVLTQIAAVQAAIEKIGLRLLGRHVRHRILGAGGAPADTDAQSPWITRAFEMGTAGLEPATSRV
jgi:DNA-binding FrmR family transcriptional regulator